MPVHQKSNDDSTYHVPVILLILMELNAAECSDN